MIEFNKIISAEQTRNADKHTIENEPIRSIDLMERASEAFVNSILSEINKKQTIHIFCGCGNNGGDGFSVARILHEKEYLIKTYLVKYSDKLSEDCRINYEILDDVDIIHNVDFKLDIYENDVVIDAIFGSGLTRIVDNSICEFIFNTINKSNSKIISIDIPSGLFCDSTTPKGNIVEADLTISFQRPKLSFFLAGYGDYVNNWKAVDIGLDEKYIQSQNSNFYYLDERVEKLIKKRKKFSHKGTYGHALIIAGSYGKIGAAVLASQKCLQYGVGLLTTHVPKCGYDIIQSTVPQAMCTTDSNYEYFVDEKIDINKYSSIAIGPGIDTQTQTKKVVKSILTKSKIPLVIDADALNIIAEENLHHLIPKNSIITPHPKEFERLFGKTENSFEQLELAIKKASELDLVIVLKGAHTAVINNGGKVYFNTTGSPKLAQAGSGDKLTGILCSFMAQGYNSLESSLISVYLHGKKE